MVTLQDVIGDSLPFVASYSNAVKIGQPADKDLKETEVVCLRWVLRTKNRLYWKEGQLPNLVVSRVAPRCVTPTSNIHEAIKEVVMSDQNFVVKRDNLGCWIQYQKPESFGKRQRGPSKT
mmetsp:Transcript_17500/g.50433  ORF Transcript_17500/g.50433 Transcript_17500/m.50433 type:complete len:120 (-) Transcript_17500:86-445(-)